MATILIADDDEKLRLLIQTTLSSSGHKVLHAADGLQTLEIVRAERPHLVLLDLMMPRMQGYEVCKKIRSESDPEIKNVKILVISIKSYPVDIRQAKEIGVDEYLVKPFTQKQLKETIAKMLSV